MGSNDIFIRRNFSLKSRFWFCSLACKSILGHFHPLKDNTMSNEGGLGVGECKLVGGRFEYPPNQG
jgi:hypothetical protein